MLTVYKEHGKYAVWEELDTNLHMEVAQFEFKADAELFIKARQAPIVLGYEDIVEEGPLPGSMEDALRKYLRRTV